MIKYLNLNRFKENMQKKMLSNFSINLQNFVRKLSKLTELLIVDFFVLKITISNGVSEKRKLGDYDYLGRFLLRFHALIDPYRLTFLAENQLLN